MGKKEKVLDEVLIQTKSIRKSFEDFERTMEKKNREIEMLKESLDETKQELANIKSTVNKQRKLETSWIETEQELTMLKASVNKTNTELSRLRSLEMQVDSLEMTQKTKEREGAVVVSSLLEWQQGLETLQRQQKTCRVCRKEAKARYRRHKSQER